jgi:hypothetical protein
VDASPGIPEVDELPVDASPGIPEVDELPVDASPGIPEVDELAVYDLPRTFPAAKFASYPTADPPDPPPGYFCVVVIRVTLEEWSQTFPLVDQPRVTRMEIIFVHRPICVTSHFARIRRYGSPKVGNKSVQVVDRFCPVNARRAEQYSTRSEKRFNVIVNLAKSFPDKIGDHRLSAKPWERGL